jgi:hypothetical protein
VEGLIAKEDGTRLTVNQHDPEQKQQDEPSPDDSMQLKLHYGTLLH